MRRVSVPLIAVALAVVGGLLAGSSVSAQPALDLKGMVLTAGELGAGWRFLEDQAAVSDRPGYDVAYERTSPSSTANGFIEIILLEDPEETSTPQEVVSTFAEDYREDLSDAQPVVDQVPPAAVGRDTAQARFRIDHPNIPPYLSNTDLIAWRRGPVLAIVMYSAASDVNVVPFAQQQDAKLAAALAPPSPQPATTQVGGLPDLAPALLAPTDLDGIWSVSEDDRREDGCGVAVWLALPQPDNWHVMAFLFYDPSGDAPAFDLLQLGIDEFRESFESDDESDDRPWDLSVTSAAAPPLTQETARARVTARRDGDVLLFDIVTWRRGPMAALVMTVAEEEVDALPYAERQDAKLAAFLDAQPNIAQAAAGCRPLRR